MFRRRDSSQNLLRLIKERKWSSIWQYLDQAKLFDDTNTCALHEVCNDPTAPIRIVKAIYYAYPGAVLTKNISHETPLLIAADVGFEEAVIFLANTCPAACELCDAHGSNPLRSVIYILRYNNMINSILNANPRSAFIADDEEDTAFDYFFRHWNVHMRVVVHNPTMDGSVLDDFIGDYDWKIGDVYRNTCLFLKAANFHRTGVKLDDNCLLHCALREVSCHWAFCKMLMKLHPDQILQRDSDGNLPIHIIAASKESCDEESFLCVDCFMIKSELVNIEYMNGNRQYCCVDCFEWCPSESVRNLFQMKPVQKVVGMVKQLLAINSQMVLIPDYNGNYPLNIAIYNQQSYTVVNQLYRAFPDTGMIRDKHTKLLPFMLAAVGNWENLIDQMTIIYLLLREDPLLIFGP